jgi:hypothetical protein
MRLGDNVRAGPGSKSKSPLGEAVRRLELKYRDVEYTVVQGIGRQLWKWGFALEGKGFTGQAATKAEAVAEAERAIDRALAPKKLKLVHPERDR